MSNRVCTSVVWLNDPFRLYFDSTDNLYQKDTDSKPGRELNENVKKKQAKPEGIRCIKCLTYVTDASNAIEVQGHHQHTVTNPGGVTFDICLYETAECQSEGTMTYEYSWFTGYAWRIVTCVQCQQHLGWSYQREGSLDFYGFIADRLIEIQ